MKNARIAQSHNYDAKFFIQEGNNRSSDQIQAYRSHPLLIGCSALLILFSDVTKYVLFILTAWSGGEWNWLCSQICRNIKRVLASRTSFITGSRKLYFYFGSISCVGLFIQSHSNLFWKNDGSQKHGSLHLSSRQVRRNNWAHESYSSLTTFFFVMFHFI